MHLAAPGSRGLIARAIMQSGACSDARYAGAAAAEAQGDALAEAVGSRGPGALACLRGKSADELVRALPMKRGLVLRPGIWWGPVADGAALPRIPLEAMRAGDFARVPLVIGANRDEGALHTVSFDVVTTSEVEGFVADAFRRRRHRAGRRPLSACHAEAGARRRHHRRHLRVPGAPRRARARRPRRAGLPLGVPRYPASHPTWEPYTQNTHEYAALCA